MRALEVVVVLPFLELGREHLGVVDHDSVEQPVELLGVDPVRALDLSVEPRRAWSDVHVLDAEILNMPVERGTELRAVVGLDALDAEGERLQNVVDELDRGLLAEALIHPQHAKARAVVDRRELVVPAPRALERRDELHVELQLVAGLGLLVALPALVVRHMALGGRQPAETQAPQDAPDARDADHQLVVAAQVHRDLLWPEVVRLTQVHDLAYDLGAGGLRAAVRTTRAVLEAGNALLDIAPQPHVIALTRDAVIAAGEADVAADFPGVTDDRQAPGCGSRPLFVGHLDPSSFGRPKCQRRPSVLDGAGGGSRTLTDLSAQGILSP